jgi:hypothetical protein
MADKTISQLTQASALVGTELLVTVQSGETKQTTVNKVKNTLVPYNLTVSADDTVNLSSSIFDQAMLIKLSWTGGSGNMTIAIRFISNGGFNTNTRARVTPSGGDTLDGSTNYYEVNVAYEGIKIWSDGNEWFIIQKKS